MKLLEGQINELIAIKKNELKHYKEEIAANAEAWGNIEETALLENPDFWDELDDLTPYMTPKQVDRFLNEVRLAVLTAVALEIRKSNPLLAAAFDATK
jgi:hypothetical protein